jgi:ADP-ribosylglycohydrolase
MVVLPRDESNVEMLSEIKRSKEAVIMILLKNDEHYVGIMKKNRRYMYIDPLSSNVPKIIVDWFKKEGITINPICRDILQNNNYDCGPIVVFALKRMLITENCVKNDEFKVYELRALHHKIIDHLKQKYSISEIKPEFNDPKIDLSTKIKPQQPLIDIYQKEEEDKKRFFKESERLNGELASAIHRKDQTSEISIIQQIDELQREFKNNFSLVATAINKIIVGIEKRTLRQKIRSSFLGYFGGTLSSIDEGELATCLLTGLIDNGPTLNLDRILDDVKKNYDYWFDTLPISRVTNYHKVFQDKRLDESYVDNKALKRVVPIVYWAVLTDCPIKTVIDLVRSECMITHPSILCQDLNVIYVFLLIQLFKDYSNALNSTDIFVNENDFDYSTKSWYNNARNSIDYRDVVNTDENSKELSQLVETFQMTIIAVNRITTLQSSYDREMDLLRTYESDDKDSNGMICGAIFGIVYNDVPEIYLNRANLLKDKRPGIFNLNKIF